MVRTSRAATILILFIASAEAHAQDEMIKTKSTSEVDAFVASHSEMFGGVIIDEDSATVTVQVAPGARPNWRSDLGNHLKSNPSAVGREKDFTVLTETVSHSAAELRALQDAIDADDAWVQQAGSKSHACYTDYFSNSVVVEVDRITANLQAYVRKNFGDKVTLAETPIPSLQSRTNDTQPFWGGDAITDWTSGCSSGFSIISSTGQTAALSAGHCFPMNDNLSLSGGPAFGTVTFRTLCNGCVDSEVISGHSYGGSVWTGASNTAAIGGTWRTSVGDTVCNAGSVTQWACGTVQARDLCTTFDNGIRVCHLTSVTSSSTLSQRGDSGGPWVRSLGGFWYGVGTHVGGTPTAASTTSYIHELQYVVPAGWQLELGR